MSRSPARIARPRDAAFASLALVALVALVFGRAAGYGFVPWDDPYNVYESPELALPLGRSLAAMWRGRVFASYLPVTRSAWALLWHATHAPAAFHLLNLAVHALNVLLVFRLLRRLVPDVAAAAAGAALFAAHPFQVEPVVWVTGLKDLLGATFSLLALDALARVAGAWADPRSPGAAGRRADLRSPGAGGAGPGPWDAAGGRRSAAFPLLLATVAYGLALLAKSSSVVVPPMALALALVLGAPRGRTLALTAIGIALAVPVVRVTRLAEGDIGLPPLAVPWPLRLRVALDALGFYLTRLAAPFDLGADHGRTPDWVLAHPGSWAVAALAVAVGVALAVVARGRPRLALAGAWFALPLLPVLGLIPFLYQRISTVADRYAYLAMLGPALALALLWRAAPGRLARAAVVAALAACALAGGALVPAWRDGDALFAHVLARNPASWMAYANRGLARGEQRRLAEAASDLRAAIALRYEVPEAHSNLGNVYYLMGRPDSAAAEWRAAIRLRPTLASPQRNLGQLLAVRGDTAEAVEHLRAALRLTPGDTVVVAALRSLGAAGGAAPAR